MNSSLRKILCVGDSLGLPREGVSYESTWYYRVQKNLTGYHVISRFQRALTTDSFIGGNRFDFLEYFSPDYVILQVGIVDCAPRLFRKGSIIEKLLAVLPGRINQPIWKFIKQKRKRQKKNAYVSPIQFERNMINYLNRCNQSGVRDVVLIKILNPGISMIEKNPEITDQVANYNAILSKIQGQFSFVHPVDLSDHDPERLFIEDGYHLSEYGNEIIANRIIEFFKKS